MHPIYFFHHMISTPAKLEEQPRDEFETSLEDEMKEKEEERDQKMQEPPASDIQEKHEEEESEEDDGMEWELRNTESVFSELSELSRDYLESVDQGASIRGDPSTLDCNNSREITR